MKKILKISAIAISAILLSTILVSATVATTAAETIELSSSQMPVLNCKMAMSQAHGIFSLIPREIQTTCRNEYSRLSSICKDNSNFKYGDVRIKTVTHDGLVDVSFTYGGYSLCVKNTTWKRIDEFFAE